MRPHNIFIKNAERLELILSENNNTLLDMNAISGVPDMYNLTTELNKDMRSINIPRLYDFCNYLGSLRDFISINDNVFTSNEVIDKEIPKIIKILLRSNDSLINFSRTRECTLFEDGLLRVKSITGLTAIVCNHLNDVCESLKRRDVLLNQFQRGSYYDLRQIVNDSYRIMFNDHKEKLCADDGIITLAVILLGRYKKPVNIVSNDIGVLNRLKAIANMIHESDNNEFKLLIKRYGIYVYNCLNKNNLYIKVYKTKRDNFLEKNARKNNERDSLNDILFPLLKI